MLSFRAWEIRTFKVEINNENKYTPELSFRRMEKIGLFLAKHVIQWIVLSSVKIWFTTTTKISIWFKNNQPKICKFFSKKEKSADPKKISFVQRAVIESKIKIKKVKERIKKEHLEKTEISEDSSSGNTEVDKII